MIKFFGALYGLDSKANSVFEIERIQRYFGFSQKRHESQQFSGAMFQDQWYVPQGDSWGSISKDAQADYLWRDKGTGSASCLLRLF
jgi:iron complex transport system substrate-binding protein